jgi:hypothetical protein
MKPKPGDALRYDVFVKDKNFASFDNTITVYIINHPHSEYEVIETSDHFAICRFKNPKYKPIKLYHAFPLNQIISLDTWDILRIENAENTKRFNEFWNALFTAEKG